MQPFPSGDAPADDRPAMKPLPTAMRLRTLLSLFLIGTAVALLFQWSFAQREGGWSALIHVGVENPDKGYFYEELGSVRAWDRWGHDGQQSYVIARDPFNLTGGSTRVDHPSYRYRRYLYSLLAGGFGQLGPKATLTGLVIVAAAGMGFATAATADIARQLGARRWAGFAPLLTIGLFESLVILSSDVLAFAFAFIGLALWLRGRKGASAMALVAAVLSKEVYLLFALGLGAAAWWSGKRRQALRIAGIPTVVAVIWALLLQVWLSADTAQDQGSFTLPFFGIGRAAWVWAHEGTYLTAAIALVSLVSAPLMGLVLRDRLLTWLSLPWVGLAIVTSEIVWWRDAFRAFAPLWLFTILGLGVFFARQEARLRQAADDDGGMPQGSGVLA